MGKLYGDRYETIGTLGQGGQSYVYEVKDNASTDSETYALKRVINPNRYARFRSEVEAIGRLNHPNVIKLLDHSPRESTADTPEKMFLVMPLARGGDLSKRVISYKGNLDGTLMVVRQIAAALSAAHAAGIVHRDVKPANILFTGAGHEVWLSDFGICFVKDQARITHHEEVVGPWAFMAPELEGGGVLEVKAAADIYSLGKLIYYMISGGVIVPREKLAEPLYSALFSDGGRYHLLQLLLLRMVCKLDDRIQDMSKVITDLERIAAYDRQSMISPFAPGVLSRIEQLQRQALEGKRVAAERQATQHAQVEVERQVQGQIQQWLRGELEKAATFLAEGDAMTTHVGEIVPSEHAGIYISDYAARSGVELLVSNLSVQNNRVHALQLFICHRFIVRFGVSQNHLPPLEDKDFGILPVYRCKPPVSPKQSNALIGGSYLTTDYKLLMPIVPPQQNNLARNANFYAPQRNSAPAATPLFIHFRTPQWPEMEGDLRTFVSTVCDRFVEVLTRNIGS